MAWKTTGLLPPPGSSVSHCVSSPPHLSPPRAGHLHSQPPDLVPPQQQPGGRTQVHGCRQSLDHTKTASKTGNHEADVPALAGSRREETRALQKEAGQEVSGCSAGEVGGLLPFPQSSSQTGAQQSNS